MSFVVIIVVLIITVLFALVFSFGFFMGLSRKKKDIKFLEEEQLKQKKTQESIISYFMKDRQEEFSSEDDSILPVKIITGSYKRIKKFLKFKKFYEALRNESVIKYIRKYAVSYIGIAVLMLGIGFFIKHSVNSAYINTAGRFFITLALSVFLIFLAYLMSKKYKTFSSILTGGAVGMLYVSFTVAHYTYNIFTDFQVFSVYFILTLFSVILSLFYNRFELLLSAVTIGFSAPLFSGIYNGNSTFLLLYLLLLDIGAVFISVRFKNYLIRLIPSLFSGLYLILIIRYAYIHHNFESFGTDFIMLNLLYIVMIILSVAYHVKHVGTYKLYELMTVVVVNLIYYSVGMYLLDVLNPDYKGVFTALTAVYNMIFLIIIVLIRNHTSEQLVYFFGIVSLLFITLIPPVELVGKSQTMIWAVETVLLMWVSFKLQIKMLKFVTALLMLGLIISFSFDVVDNFFSVSFNAPEKTLLINKSFISGLMTSAGLALNVIIASKSKEKYLFKPVKMSWFRIFISLIAVAVFYISLYTEILYQITLKVKNSDMISIYIGIYNFAFLAAGTIIILFINNRFLKAVGAMSSVIAFVLFFSYYLYKIITVRDHLLSNPSLSSDKFGIHIVMIAIILLIFCCSYFNVKTLGKYADKAGKWVLSLFAVAVLSTELDHIAVIKSFGSGIPVSTILANTHYFYYSLFWTISAFIMSLFAIIFKDVDFIRISMTVLLVVIIKSFIFDFPDLTVGQQIVTFTVLGFVILFTAFGRQRLFEKIF